VNKLYINFLVVSISLILSIFTLSQARNGTFVNRGLESLENATSNTVSVDEPTNQEQKQTEVNIIDTRSTRNIVNSVVYIEVTSCPGDGISDYIAAGSGSNIDQRGLVLTNYHVIEGCRGDIYIGVTSSPDQDPELKYIAEVVTFDRDLDLAVLNITKSIPGNSNFTGNDLAYLSIGNSDFTSLGDDIDVWGYPGSRGDNTGQSRINITKGTVSGIDSYKGYRRGWIISDVNLTWGNSGGAALNNDNELIGIPTEGRGVGMGAGVLGALRPVNLALDLIEDARNITGKK
tara:strand:+ start:252 stop:1118 length:867 start_codon:yes stop_codon:yes gene_type:complete